MSISAAMKDHIAGNVLFLVGLWKVTAKDGTIIALTNSTREITYNSQLYSVLPILPSQIEVKKNFEAAAADVRSILHSSVFSKTDLARGRWRGARVEHVVVNPLDLSMDYAERHVFEIGEVQTQGEMFQAQLDSLSVRCNQSKGALTQPMCRAELGDAVCTKDLTAFTFAATITAVTDNGTFTVSVTQALQYFRNGTCKWTAGGNVGATARIKDNTGTGATIVLLRKMRANVSIGDTVTLVAGDDKTRTTCRDKFANVVNFDGEPDQPGNFALYKFPE
jgi:uncharacterized phage protein (TIGR02218 family)